MTSPFHLSPDADVTFTGLAGEIEVAPSKLVQRFGPPGPGEGFKSSGCYSFEGPEGEVFTVYDWKATSLFYVGEMDPSLSHLPKPEDFWLSPTPHQFKVGARRGSKYKGQFREWLIAEVAA
jgi:hypothetical protein